MERASYTELYQLHQEVNYPGCGGGVGGGLCASCYRTESNSEETGMDGKKEIKSTLPAS